MKFGNLYVVTFQARNVQFESHICTFLVDLERELCLIYVVASHHKRRKCTFRVTNLHLFVELEWKLGEIYVEGFQHNDQKYTF